MGMVTIGGRELRVLEQHEPGSFQVEADLVKAQAALQAARDADDVSALHDRLAEIVHCYVRCNDGVTVDWLKANLAAQVGPLVRECILASGLKPKEPASQGEAARP